MKTMHAVSTLGRRMLAALVVAGLLGLVPVEDAAAQTRPALVRDVDSQPRSARYTERAQFQFAQGQFVQSFTITPTIPVGKRLLLQSVSMHTLLTDNQSLMEARLSIDPGAVARFWIDQEFQATASGSSNPQRHFTGNLALSVMLEPGESLNFFMFRNDALGQSALNFGNVTVVGYFVDTP